VRGTAPVKVSITFSALGVVFVVFSDLSTRLKEGAATNFQILPKFVVAASLGSPGCEYAQSGLSVLSEFG
jgi:hypothetical protein